MQRRHFFTLGEHPEQTVMCPHGAKSTFLRWSEQTKHSSKSLSSGPPTMPSPRMMPCMDKKMKIGKAGRLFSPALLDCGLSALCRTSAAPCIGLGPDKGPRGSGGGMGGGTSKHLLLIHTCPFLFLMPRSAPLAARKQAMLALDFLSAPWLPRPINSFPTS